MMKRDKYIDIAKGIGIILVLLGHLPFNMKFINVIYIFHMPLFFYISGIYVKRTPFTQWFSRNKSLMNYYFAFGLFFSVLGSRNLPLIFEDILFLLRSSTSSVWHIRWFGPFWFILSLFVIKLIHNQIKYSSSTLISLVLFFLAYMLNLEYDHFLLNLPLALGPALMMLLFFNLGQYHKQVMKFYEIENTIYLLITFALFNVMVIYLFGGSTEKLVNYQQLKVLYPLLLAIFGGYLGILATLFFAKIIENHFNKTSLILAYIGKHSLLIFAWHLFIYFLIKKAMLILGIQVPSLILKNLFLLISAVAITLVFIETTNFIKSRLK